MTYLLRIERINGRASSSLPLLPCLSAVCISAAIASTASLRQCRPIGASAELVQCSIRRWRPWALQLYVGQIKHCRCLQLLLMLLLLLMTE